MLNLNALLIGRSHYLAWNMPELLAKAGFQVDAITSSPFMRHCRWIRDLDYIPSTESLLPAIQQKLQRKYDLIVPTEDGVLSEILDSSLPVQQKLKLLPVCKEQNFLHLSSKIGLSKTFASHGICTPPFAVASNLAEAKQAAAFLKYPVLVKIDRSGGGFGVFACDAPADFAQIKPAVFEKPVLVQKKIEGIELDVSAIYMQKQLIHFSHSRFERVCLNRFGPSVLRTYRPLSQLEEPLFQELSQIGKALGANGFTNMGCIQQADGRRFYFEADMRPNVWVMYPQFLGDDPALHLQRWFRKKEPLTYPVPSLPNQPSQILLPYFLRLKRWELLCNRYNVWRYIPSNDLKLSIRLIWHELFRNQTTGNFIPFIKWLIPKKYHPKARKLYKKIFDKRFLLVVCV